MAIRPVHLLLKFRKFMADTTLRASARQDAQDGPILRSELCSAAEMQRHGAQLARQHRLGTSHKRTDYLLPRLADNARVLARSSQVMTQASQSHMRITPAAEWLLDNYYLIEEQIAATQTYLPREYSFTLPRLENASSRHLPRAYDIALKVVSHGDGRLDDESLRMFVAGYQSVAPLTLGELWAIPIMLRLALIENLRRIAAFVVGNWSMRNQALEWSSRLIRTAERDPNGMVLTVADMAHSHPPMEPPFVAELSRCLQGQSIALSMPLTWIEQRLAHTGRSIEQLVQMESQQQAATQASVSNSIGSLRALVDNDWRTFVEKMSVVEHVLREDPSGVYPRMDFATRDKYRHVVERLARASGQSEESVARAALEMARDGARAQHGTAVQSHVGFFLVDRGRHRLERELKLPWTLARAWHRALLGSPLTLFIGPVALLTAAVAAPFMLAAIAGGWPIAALVPLALATMLMSSRIALALVHWLVALTVRPRMLPRLDFEDGIPASARTLVAIPALIGTTAEVEELVEDLEVRHLANRDPHIQFGLLTDFKDAASRELPGDARLLEHARHLIDALNDKYASDQGDRFHMFHRPRQWNRSERTWMGYERKRGKLHDLNELLLSGRTDQFMMTAGDIAALTDIRYVITLDADTQLPPDTARKFVGAMEHPLNHAVYDPVKQRVTAGYAILQPRVGTTLQSTAKSLYAQLSGSDAGIDPYTRASADMYQDLFGQGSFIGKGIYAVEPFQKALEGRFPENCILSHDLIEGNYARSGLLSDVYLYEDVPALYSTHVLRQHRWIRGDWQLLPWLSPWVRSAGGRIVRNRLSALSRWKMLDNLRRSLEPIGLLAVLLVGWLAIGPMRSWYGGVLALLFITPLLSSALALVRKPRDIAIARHVAVVLRDSVRQLLRTVLFLAWLPHEAWYSMDAIVRTLWRLFISHRHLLQWNASSEVARTSVRNLTGLARMMWIGPALALTVCGLLWSSPVTLAWASPLLVAWLLSPWVAWWVSKPPGRSRFAPSAAQLRLLRTLSRRTWAFFDQHVSADEHWLPPDNMQEAPVSAIAHRTSPTNMGLALLAYLAAHDFGYLGGADLLERIGNTLGTMQDLERHRGHFYNWYDTRTLQPLKPRYVSSVDSGNLAGHLLTLRAGLLALPDQPVFEPRVLEGLGTTIEVVMQTLDDDPDAQATLDALHGELHEAWSSPPQSLAATARMLQRVLSRTRQVCDTVQAAPDGETSYWLQALRKQCHGLASDARHWSVLPEPACAQPAQSATASAMPTWRVLAGIDVDTVPAGHRDAARACRREAAERVAECTRLAGVAAALAIMDFRFLYDTRRHLLSIGYNLDERRMDSGHYDLLASESRLTLFVLIAQGQLPQEAWFSMGRLLTTSGGAPVLLSWSGALFEYLMPMLVMPSYTGTLLDRTCHTAVARQIEYGKQLGLPWGISESGYNALDTEFNYQYRAFGVPGLGLKRGLGEDIVIAPYASALGLMVAPTAAVQNLSRLVEAGFMGRFGLYEAIDFTPARVPQGQSHALVQSFMAHHQGMSLLAFADVLLGAPMRRRFASDRQCQANMLLLEERVPKAVSEYLHAATMPTASTIARAEASKLLVFTEPDRPQPAVQLLSNGRYHVMVGTAGGGYSRCHDMAVTRWHEDPTRDHWGSFCYVRDTENGRFWSTTHQPTVKRVEHYEAIFSDARAEYRVREDAIDAHTEIVVSPEDDIELRRINLTNHDSRRRSIELTSYAEVVLAAPLDDAMHPSFSKLFVQTELVEPLQAILCTRRPRSSDEKTPWMCHLLAVHDAHAQDVCYETDRARFIGRGRDLIHPAAMDACADADGRLSNTAGAVLDPVVSIRCRLLLEPGQTAIVDLVTGVDDSRDACMGLIGKYRDRHLADRVFGLAWTHSRVFLTQLNATPAEARIYEKMAAAILYANPKTRADSAILAANRRDQSGLWGQSISGDRPIVLLQISDPLRIELVRQLVQAHAYWRQKGLSVDLLVWNEDQSVYRQQLRDQIMALVSSGVEAGLIDQPGGIFVRPAQQLSREDRILTRAVARIVLSDTRGSLEEQLLRPWVETDWPRFDADQLPEAADDQPESTDEATLPASQPLLFGNPYGGFSADGNEYIITLAAGQATPAPWVNVLANPEFGSVVSERGNAYTWSENAHELRLTPWCDDPVADAGGEAIYLRDEDSGRYWSPTPWPRRGRGTYRTRHGFGYSVFEHVEDGIRSQLRVYVAIDAPVKFFVLELHNASGRTRHLSATGYVEWLLGDLRQKTAMHIVTEVDAASGAVFARNPYLIGFPQRVAFLDVEGTGSSFTCDRTEFLGRNGTLRAPAAMAQPTLSGRVGAGMDPCAAIRKDFRLDDGDSCSIVFRLGASTDAAKARALAEHWQGLGTATRALEAVHAHWRQTLDAVRVQTPEPAVDLLANGWLMYQVMASRLYARSGYYQSGGAFGFRDQLQDTMSMLHAAPGLVRRHLLLCAAHQFREGDVQHWWHPPQDRGVRTHCSDDYLWLALATSRYVRITGDADVLDEMADYLEGPPVPDHAESHYDLPSRSSLRETLYQHCVRAIEHSMARGAHGLPLIGTGDWNDGMNKLGEKGRGESVWLAFFVYHVLCEFAEVARIHDDEHFAQRCESQAAALKDPLEQHGWDGDWYRRAYFDDGTPLGSARNDACRIDSISQSWAVISGAAPEHRQRLAMQAVEQHLVRADLGVVQLLHPPFDQSTSLDPGYIKGYLPGVRENGGQYTHAAIWAGMAFAELGDSERAWKVLDIINPIRHGLDGASADVYKVEPYVMAADVYSVRPHVGRGGWTWYTGSGGWMYRLILESLLGLRVEGSTLRIQPVARSSWTAYDVHYRFRETPYHVTVHLVDADAPAQSRLDGVLQSGNAVTLVDDGRDHDVLMQVPRRP